MAPKAAETTTTVANAAQSEAWNGPEGTTWAEHSTGRAPDADLTGPVLDAAAIAPHDRVLDIGCGTGELTRRAARQAAEGWAVGVDLSAQMVDQARRTADEEGIGNAVFAGGDAQTHPFSPASFDVAVSHFGAMFFADPVAAFANVARALRPGGRLAFCCPQAMARCDWYGVPLAALLGRRPTESEAPSAMFSLADAAVVRDVLASAGFVGVELRPLDRALWFGADAGAAADMFLGSGPVRAIIERTPSLRAAEARAALEDAVRPYAGPDGVRIHGAHWLVHAVRPEAVRPEAARSDAAASGE